MQVEYAVPSLDGALDAFPQEQVVSLEPAGRRTGQGGGMRVIGLTEMVVEQYPRDVRTLVCGKDQVDLVSSEGVPQLLEEPTRIARYPETPARLPVHLEEYPDILDVPAVPYADT